MSEFVAFSLCSSSVTSKAKEMSVAGLPPDEMQETTQKSFPPCSIISALMVTLGLTVKQKVTRVVLLQAPNVFSNNLKSQMASRVLRVFVLNRKLQPDELNVS